MPGRIQSPSSINTYKQCPRKYYFVYIKQLPTKPSIHLIRGTVVHETLEYFFERPILDIAGEPYTNVQYHLLSIVKERWIEHDAAVNTLGLTATDVNFYKEETRMMLLNWLQDFWQRLQREMRSGLTYEQAFARHTPRREEEYVSVEHKVRGYVDAVHDLDGEIHIRDYKTSKNPIIGEEYKLQLAIYAFLYKHNHGIMPKTVGIFFLKHGEQLMEVNDELIAFADLEIRWVHERTQSTDIRDYPKRPSPLCNYCDFYDFCWKQREITDF